MAHLFPQAVGLVGVYARAAEIVVQQAARRERAVAHELRRQPEPRRTRQQAVVGILLQQFWCRLGLLTVGLRHHHLVQQATQIPATGDEICRQQVE